MCVCVRVWVYVRVCLSIFMCTTCLDSSRDEKRGSDSSVTWSCRKWWAAQYGWLESNSGSLGDQWTLLVIETPIRPPVAVLSFSKYFLLPELDTWTQTTSMETWDTTVYCPQPPMAQSTANPGMKCRFYWLFLIHSSSYMCSWWKPRPQGRNQRIFLSIWVSASTFPWLQGVNSNL